MKQSFALAALAGIAMAKNLIGDASFITFQSLHNKSYTTASDYNLRKVIYNSNDRLINAKNA